MPSADPSFAINHMTAPRLSIGAFFDLAVELGAAGVEIRNDLAGNAIIDGTPAAVIREEARQRGLRILSINALQRFNEWTPAREKEARDLAAYAADVGAEALVLVPTNDSSGREDGVRQANLRTALKGLAPILADAGVTGLVEPLGFEACSLRRKSEAVDAIGSLGLGGQFKIVHDTFHHHLAGESAMFPQMTGLVHISGVTDPGVTVAGMRDSHRVLVDRADRLGNVAQIATLLANGLAAPLSFEPFAESVHALADPASALRDSIGFIRDGLSRASA